MKKKTGLNKNNVIAYKETDPLVKQIQPIKMEVSREESTGSERQQQEKIQLDRNNDPE